MIFDMEEIWQDIQGFENKYQVSNTGKVRSLNYYGTDEIHELKQGHGNTRYAQVCLVKDGKRNTRRVHRLVAEAFLDNPEGKPFIDHIDGNPLNNVVSNLRFVSPAENSGNPNTKDNGKGPRTVVRARKQDREAKLRLERMRTSNRNIIKPGYEVFFDQLRNCYILSVSASTPTEYLTTDYLNDGQIDFGRLWGDMKRNMTSR